MKQHSVIEIFIAFGYFATFILGIIGNLLSFKIFSRDAFKGHSFTIYFKFMTLNDLTITIYSATFILRSVFNIDLRTYSSFLCPTIDYITYILSPISSYLLVVISIDRFIKIQFQSKFGFFFRPKFQITLIFLIYTFNVIIFLTFFWNQKLTRKIIPSSNTTVTTCDDKSTIQDNTEIYAGIFLPFGLMIFFSGATIIHVFRSRFRVTRQSGTSQLNRLSKKDKKFAFTSVSLNIVYLTLNLPLILLIELGENLNPDIYNKLTQLLNIFYYTNYAIGFFLQITANSIFRNEFFKMLHLKHESAHIDVI